jgi:hypothetical protein
MNVKWYLHAAKKLKTGIGCRVVREDTVMIYCIDALEIILSTPPLFQGI